MLLPRRADERFSNRALTRRPNDNAVGEHASCSAARMNDSIDQHRPLIVDCAISPVRVWLWCASIATMFLVAFGATQYYRHYVAPNRLAAAMAQPDWPVEGSPAERAAKRNINDPRGIVRQFDLDSESNLPTAWSTMQLLIAAGLLLVIAVHHRRTDQRATATPSIAWMLLGGGFILLAFDETAGVHNLLYLSSVSEDVRRTRGVFYFSWVVPAGALVLAIGLAYLRFLFRLPKRTRSLFVAAGAVYVIAAIGGEMVMGSLISRGLGDAKLSVTVALIAFEEFGEMLAIATFIYALLDFMGRTGVSVMIAADTPTPAVAPRPEATGESHVRIAA
jgi:hypothetical protein